MAFTARADRGLFFPIGAAGGRSGHNFAPLAESLGKLADVSLSRLAGSEASGNGDDEDES
jgi:hypothetical protein